MKTLALIIYSWGTTILFSSIIIWLATIPNLEAGNNETDEAIKVLFRMTLYAILFLLVYRSIIVTLKSSVERLSQWRSKREEIEDAEFVLIIETLVIIISILLATLFSISEEYIQQNVDGRHSEIKDVLVSTMSILLTAMFVYTVPILGELEVLLKVKTKNLFKKFRKEN